MDFNVPESTDDGLPENLPSVEKQKMMVAEIEALKAQGVAEEDAIKQVFEDPKYQDQ